MKKLLLLLLLPVVAFGQPVNPIISGGTGTGGGGGSATNIGVSTSGGLLTTSTNGTGDFTIVLTPTVVGAVTSSNALYAEIANTYTGLVFTAREGAPLNINIGNLKRLRMDLVSQTPDIWLLGDDALNPHDTLIESLDNWATRGGSALGWDVGPYIGTWNAGTITHPTWAGNNEPWPSYVGMANGSSVTNQYNAVAGSINGITTGEVTIYGWKMTGFGTLTLRTQTLIGGVLGTPTTILTVNCDNGSASLTPFTTNVSIALTDYLTASVYSSGTNMIYSIGQRNTNAGSGYKFSQFHGGSFEIGDMMANSFKSNTFRTFLAAWPPSLVLFHDKSPTNTLYSGLALFHQMMTNAGFSTDMASVTTVPRTNDFDTGRTERLSVLNWARNTGRTALDTWSLFEPFDVTSFIPYYTADAVHLTTFGNEAVSSSMINWLGLDAASLTTMQYRYRETISNIITAAVSSPEGSSGGIRFSNNIYLGWPSNGRRIVDNRTTVGTVSAAGSTTHTVQTYSENNNHGLGIGVADGVTGGYWSSDGSLIFTYLNGGSGSLRARFDLANSTNYFTGGLGASYFNGNGSQLTSIPASAMAGGSQGQVVTWHGSSAIWSNPPAGGGSTTITNTASAAGLVVGGSGSFGIGTNLSSVAGGTNQFWVAASPPNEKYTNRFGNTDEISGAYRVLTVGTNVGNNVQISDGISSFPNGMWIDAGAQEYFVGKISVGTSRGQFQLGSGAVSNLTATGVIYAPGLEVPQLSVFPTNYIPSSSSGVTNFVLLNLTNTINGGGLQFVATNTAASGSFLLRKITQTETAWP